MRATIDTSLDSEGLGDGQRGLLDLIDKLQFCQLENVKLPQIVVVGDQSAGKSSVLEALTGTPFPRDAGACTRFATEIRLRRDKTHRLAVSIIPDKNRPYDEQSRLAAFGGKVAGDTSFEALMREAVEQIAPKNLPGRFAARDVLVVEKSGPDMPLLTLVDLPGLVRVANRDQSEKDIQTIEALSDRYMKSSRTIILAVIGGNNDYVQAPILKKARQFDPMGSRTIGVLTKPDLTEQIGLEDKFIELVGNKDAENNFKLGWYVLLNPGPPRDGEPWPSPEQRRAREDEFFGRGKWSTLPRSMCGIAALRQKLSLQLQRHIGRHVKTLRRQIQKAHERCEAELKAMGTARDTVEEMRQEMGELFSASNHLVTPAVDGTYKNPPGERFFAKQSDPRGTPSQKLRARVREESERFAKRFRQSGRKMNFSSLSSSSSSSSSAAALPEAGSVHSSAKREFAQREVEPLLSQIRGNELPLDSNPRAPYILFQDYSANWPTLAQEYKDNLGVICNEFLADVIDYVWPVRMREPLRGHFLEPHMKDMMEKADAELARLKDDMELEIQPFDPEYENRLRKWRFDASADGGTYTEAEEVLEKMLIYYELTARIFIRNVVTQVVERHLLLGMLRLFNPVKILAMKNDVVEGIAAENRETRDRRNALKKQKAAVEEAKSICANLAMRSELRAYDDVEIYEDSDSDAENTPPSTSASGRGQTPSYDGYEAQQHHSSRHGSSSHALQHVENQPQLLPARPSRSASTGQKTRDRNPQFEETPPVPSLPAPAVPERPVSNSSAASGGASPVNPGQHGNYASQQPQQPARPPLPPQYQWQTDDNGYEGENDGRSNRHANIEAYYSGTQQGQGQSLAVQDYQPPLVSPQPPSGHEKKERRYRLPRLGGGS